METYTFLREFADSWFLIAMFAFFVTSGLWAFRPSRRADQQDAAQIPFRDTVSDCTNACKNCACARDFLKDETHG